VPASHAPPQSNSAQSQATASDAIAIAAVQRLIAGQVSGAVSVAALNTATGARFSAGATGGMWSASVYKLLVLETLLWQHQQAHTNLSAGEDAQARTMIENSDNVAGYDLFDSIGGRAGLTAGIKAFGLQHTTAGVSDPAFTATSAADQLILLKNLTSQSGPLDSASRSYVRSLMSHVESDQRWGIGVVADAGRTVFNKDGWLAVDNENAPGEDDEDLWITNSVGIVTVHGQQLLMAVLTRHQPDLTTGIRLVEQLTQAMAPTVAR
jgi:beta-lactamase class A